MSEDKKSFLRLIGVIALINILSEKSTKIVSKKSSVVKNKSGIELSNESLALIFFVISCICILNNSGWYLAISILFAFLFLIVCFRLIIKINLSCFQIQFGSQVHSKRHRLSPQFTVDIEHQCIATHLFVRQECLNG